jgi:aminopeptidase N
MNPGSVLPICYRIRIEPDLMHFHFYGNLEMEAEARRPLTQVILDAVDLAIFHCKVELGGESFDCPFRVDPGSESLVVDLPREHQGRFVLSTAFVGLINDRMAGFYRTRYKAGDHERYAAVTQFEESDARRALPCFDHPAHKAAFEVEMIVDKDLHAVSNMPAIEERPVEGGKKHVRFERTPKMPTYLLFFGVGEFERLEDPGRVLVRVLTMPGMSEYGRFGLRFGRQALEFCEDYYGTPYPLPKLDLIAISDFAAGAMENWGAITFRENLLLHDPQVTSKSGEERICGVIAHEMAHQWFGNLVSPADWKYLWLNESFATFLGYDVVDHYFPGWEMWSQFLYGQTEAALDRDALQQTTPIEIPGGEHVIINVSTAPIIYNKGGSILRQIEGYIGEDSFKGGLRRYLKGHQYGSAASQDLWEAMEAVSERPVKEMMRSWVEQEGYPLIEVSRDQDTLHLRQRRFTFLPNDSPQTWMIPVAIRVIREGGGSDVISTVLDKPSTSVRIGPNVSVFKVNDGQYGFYRVKYLDDDALLRLHDGAVRLGGLPPEDRWGLQNDLFALTMGGEIPLETYLEWVSACPEEDGFLPLISTFTHLHQAHLITEGAVRERIAKTAVSLLNATLKRIGLEPVPHESNTTSVLRDHVLYQAALYGIASAEAFGRDRFRSMVQGKPVHPDIMRGVMEIGALFGGEEDLDWFFKRLTTSQSEHERMNILSALGRFKERSLIELTQTWVLDRVPARNRFIPIAAMASNPYALPRLWDFYVGHLETLEQLHPVHYERIIAAVVPWGGLGRTQQVEDFFKSYGTQKKKAGDVIGMSLERLQVHERMRMRLSKGPI